MPIARRRAEGRNGLGSRHKIWDVEFGCSGNSRLHSDLSHPIGRLIGKYAAHDQKLDSISRILTVLACMTDQAYQASSVEWARCPRSSVRSGLPWGRRPRCNGVRPFPSYSDTDDTNCPTVSLRARAELRPLRMHTSGRT